MDITSINPLTDLNLKTIIKILQFGHIDVIGQPLIGSNGTLLVNVTLSEISLHAIYKPERGEQPLWDFPPNSLSKREISAFIVSHLIGWNFVPPSIYRTFTAPYGQGSLQLFIPHDPRINFFNIQNKDFKIIQQIVLFDAIINNADRKGGHVIQDENQKIWLIDHGLCFHQEDKLRTVIWEFSNLKIPDDLMDDLDKFLKIINNDDIKLVKKLNKLLSSVEIYMVINRTRNLLESGVFPSIEQKTSRPYPWPLI